MTIWVRSQARRVGSGTPARRTRALAGYRQLRATGLVPLLIPVALFEGGNLAATLLILRANQLLIAEGFSVTAAIAIGTVFYAAYNASAALLSIPAGMLADRIGGRRVLALAGLAYAGSYFGLAFTSHSWALVLAMFLLGGVGIGLGETAESTLIARHLPDRLRGSGFGMLGLVQAGGDVTATVVGGVIFTALGAAVCFSYATVWMAAAVLAALVVRPPPRDRTGESQAPNRSGSSDASI